ncbi:hypothetical protein CEQ90_19395 [Lewinellaceae bacterium SD302]|nr:hypothetical protein CEQ90_19395 [Lewinellaceae bacterium SD302]
MSSLIARNERKAQVKAVLYTVLVLGGLAGALYLSGEAEGVTEVVKEWFGKESNAAVPVA